MVFASARGVGTRIKYNDDGTANVTKKSNMSGKEHTITMKLRKEDYELWAGGFGLIQNVMPYLTPDECEFLMTGTTKEEWDYIFGDENDGSD